MPKAPTRHLIDNGAGTIRVARWVDPLIDRYGHPAVGDYLEYFWLGTLGPTTTWLQRRLAQIADLHPDGTRLDLAELATSLGLGWESGRANPLIRSFDRLVMFGLASPLDDVLLVRTVVPPLNIKQCERLAPHLREAHGRWLSTPDGAAPPLPIVSAVPVA
jgi:hypothetical protein